MILETERLILRLFDEKDYDDLYEFLSQRKNDVFEGYPDITYENGVEHLKYRVHNCEFIAIELKDNHKVIGNIYFGKRAFKACEMGYIINKNYQRKGYASEAILKIIANAQDLHRVYAECDPENVASRALLEHLGFVQEGHLKRNVFFKCDEKGNPLWRDTLIYSLLLN